MDRASDYGSEGLGFESLLARHMAGHSPGRCAVWPPPIYITLLFFAILLILFFSLYIIEIPSPANIITEDLILDVK